MRSLGPPFPILAVAFAASAPLLVATSALAQSPAQRELSTFLLNGGLPDQANTDQGLGFGSGIYFDLVASNPFVLESLDVNTDQTTPGLQVDIWTAPGGFFPQRNNPGAWTLQATGTSGATAGAGFDRPTRIDFPDFNLPQGVTGVYLHFVNCTQNFLRNDGNLPVQVGTTPLAIREGAAVFSGATPGNGLSIFPRTFSGRIQYRLAGGLYPDFTVDNNTGPSPHLVTFTDNTFTDDPIGVLSVEYDFESDGVFDATTAAGASTAHTYGCGDHVPTVRATDSINGQLARTSDQTIVVDPLIAGFDPTNGYAAAGTPAAFDYAGSGNPTISWDFDGDGLTDRIGTPVTWTFPQQGTFPVTMTAQLNCRTQTVSGQVTVVEQVLLAPISPTREVNRFRNNTNAAYFDVDVTNPLGITVTDMAAMSPQVGEAHGYEVWGSLGVSALDNYAKSNFALLGSGQWTPTREDTLETVDVTDFYLPAGVHGLVVVHRDLDGSRSGHSWASGNVGAVSANPDLSIAPLAGVLFFVNQTSNTVVSSSFDSFGGGVIYSRGNTLAPDAPGRIGSGCAGALGPPTIVPLSTNPTLGSSYAIRVVNVDRPVSIHGGVSDTFSTVFGTPLPLALGPILGVQMDCLLRVSSDAILAPVLPGTARDAEVSFPVPNNPAFAGLTVFFQGVTFDPSVPGGILLSDAWRATVR